MLIKVIIWISMYIFAEVVFCTNSVSAAGETCKNVYQVGTLKPRDSTTTLKLGDKAPEFTLPAVEGSKISLTQYLGKKNVVISFVPAAWTPVCSAQWPVYDASEDIFRNNDAMLLGITVDNIPTLYAWIKEISINKDKLWFPVLSDFYPHGLVAGKYGVLRTTGVSERALFVIDKKGIIRFIEIHDINEPPPIAELQKALEALNR
ncbi:Antioxidant, AhpC/TSA family [uncultured Desulfobacterium sp.]|uniref:Antioxidant, AhpC/TSA family n=1 Tax=uncultured Desulfobacterium sp. TaxID=201089 RepID=A0A445MV61_9BACT|nr:Antioxidant, AhpC/TSA family [uncultured Desulfobacterium sp.]